MNKLKITALTSLGLAFLTFGLFNLIGAKIDASGILHEPFFLLPLGWFFILLAFIFGVILLSIKLVAIMTKVTDNESKKLK